MKIILTLTTSAVLLAITLAAAGFGFDVALLISIGAISGILGLFIFEYGSVRPRSDRTPTRRHPIQRPRQTPPSNHAVKFQPPPLVVHTCER